MVACKVLEPFTEYVPGKGMIVGNRGKTVDLPLRYAAQRKARGQVEYDESAVSEEAEADAARPKSSKERRLLARANRRAEQAARRAVPDAASGLGALRADYRTLTGKNAAPKPEIYSYPLFINTRPDLVLRATVGA